jgi:hypothetical protein
VIFLNFFFFGDVLFKDNYQVMTRSYQQLQHPLLHLQWWFLAAGPLLASFYLQVKEIVVY